MDKAIASNESDRVQPFPRFDLYRAADGTVVVHVETNGMDENSNGPIIRVYLNDEILFENPPLDRNTHQCSHCRKWFPEERVDLRADHPICWSCVAAIWVAKKS